MFVVCARSIFLSTSLWRLGQVGTPTNILLHASSHVEINYKTTFLSHKLIRSKTMGAVHILPFLAALLVFFSQPSPAAAYSFGVGDGLLIVLLVVIGIIGVCALLGFIARRRANS